jgi:hypothetical protein
MLVPHRQGVVFGPLGGIMQAVPFSPYDALYREALSTTSPFYRVLCAWKIYEGTRRLRQWIREQCERRGIVEAQPPDPPIDRDELIGIGFAPDFVNGIRHAGQLFERLADVRHAIAHFLIEREQDSHVYLADGSQLQLYAVASAGLLRYAHKLLQDLRLFCAHHGLLMQGGFMLPQPAIRDQFVVRARDYGMD